MNNYQALWKSIINDTEYSINIINPDPVELLVCMLSGKITPDTFAMLYERSGGNVRDICSVLSWINNRIVGSIGHDENILMALVIYATAKKEDAIIMMILPSLLSSSVFNKVGQFLPNHVLLYLIFVRNKTCHGDIKNALMGLTILESKNVLNGILLLLAEHVGDTDYSLFHEFVNSGFNEIYLRRLPKFMADSYIQFVSYNLDVDRFALAINMSMTSGLNNGYDYCPDAFLLIFRDNPLELFKMLRAFIAAKVIIAHQGKIYWNFNTLICNMIIKTIGRINTQNINLVPLTSGQEIVRALLDKYRVMNCYETSDISLIVSDRKI